MAEVELPHHVVSRRRDGRREILLHRAMAVIGDSVVEIRSSRGAVILPGLGLLLVLAAGAVIVITGGRMGLWPTVVMLIFCLFAAPLSVMGLVSAIFGADVVVDARKGSVTWQQGWLGMGVGTRDLVPFEKIDRLEVTVEGDQPDRWGGHADALRQFALVLVKTNGRRLIMAQVPVPSFGQEDGMDRVLATAQAVAGLTGSKVVIPQGWELVEVDAATGKPAERPVPPRTRQRRRQRRG